MTFFFFFFSSNWITICEEQYDRDRLSSLLETDVIKNGETLVNIFGPTFIDRFFCRDKKVLNLVWDISGLEE